MCKTNAPITVFLYRINKVDMFTHLNVFAHCSSTILNGFIPRQTIMSPHLKQRNAYEI